MADSEVKIDFVADGGNVPAELERIRRFFAAINEQVEAGKTRLADMETDVRRVSDTAGRLEDIARKTGMDEIARKVDEAFRAGAENVKKYEARMESLSERMDKVRAKAQEIMAAVESGSMGGKEGLGRMYTQYNKAKDNLGSIRGLDVQQQQAAADMQGMGGMRANLLEWERLSNDIAFALRELNDQQGAIGAVRQQLDAHSASLDKNAQGYQKQVAEIQQAHMALDAYAAKLQQVSTQMEAKQQNLGALWGSASKPAAMPAVSDAIAKEFAAFERLAAKMQEVEARVELAQQKRAAAAERAAERSVAAQERAAAAQERAATRAAAAAQKEAAASQKTTYAMELSAMSKQKLAAETRRLIAARKQAAAAGDTEAYARLTAQLGQCRTAMRSITQAAQMNKIVMLQQAQTAATMGGQLQSLGGQIAGLGEAAKNGELNLTGMATSIISLSMAIKAGMGPLGWVLLALQGLQSIWNYFAKSTKKAREEAQKAAEAFDELANAGLRVSDALREYGKVSAEIKMDKLEKAAKDSADELNRRQRDEKFKLKKEQDAAKRKEDNEREKAEREIEIEKEKLEQKRDLGQISNDDYIRELNDLNERAQKIRDDAGLKELERQKENAELEAKQASEQRQNLESERDTLLKRTDSFVQTLAKEDDPRLDKVLEEIKKRTAEISVLEAELNEWKAAEKTAESKEDKEYAANMVDKLMGKITAAKDEVESIWYRFADELNVEVEQLMHDAPHAQMFKARLRTLKAQIEEAEATERSAAQTAEEAGAKVEDYKKNSEFRKEQRESQHSIQESTRKIAERRSKELEDVKRTGSLADQKAVLMEQREQMEKGSDEWKKYTEQIRSINKQMREERLTELARTHAPEEVRAELERLRARCKEGSEAWKNYTNRIRSIEVQGVRDELEKYKRELAITTTYQHNDTRTQAEIYRWNRRRLADLAAYLRRQIAATDDYALRKDLREQLRQTLEQQRYLREATAASAREAFKALMQTQKEKPEAKKKGAQARLNAAYKEYERNIKKSAKLLLEAEKATTEEERKAKLAAAKRAKERADKAGKRVIRNSKDTAAVQSQQDENNESLRTMVEWRNSRKRAKAASDRQIAASDKKAAADNAAASATERETREKQRLAEQQQPAAASAEAARAAQLNAQATAALGQLQVALAGASTTHASLLSGVQSVATSLTNMGTATQSALAELTRRLKIAEDKIARLLAKVR